VKKTLIFKRTLFQYTLLLFILFFDYSEIVAQQNVISIKARGNAIRGENETQADALKRAYQDAQWQAARKAGEYIEVEEILFEYLIDETLRLEYISSINVISPLVLREKSSKVTKTYDYLREAERYEVDVTYEFDPKDMERRYREYISNRSGNQMEIINGLINQYNRRLNSLDSLLAKGETQTARYLILIDEITGIFNIISKDIEVRGRDISRIIERQNQIYIDLIDMYVDRLDYLLTNKYYFEIPAIKNKAFVEELNVSSAKDYMVKYRIDWYWDNQFKSEISKVKYQLENEIPDKFRPYIFRKIKKLDRKHRDIRIVTLTEKNKFSIELKRPYYRVFLNLRDQRGRLLDKVLLDNSMANIDIDKHRTENRSDEIKVKSNINQQLKYISIRYEPNYLFSRNFGLNVNLVYDYINTDTINYNNQHSTEERISYYGISFSGFYNLNSSPTPKLNAMRLRIGLTGNLLLFSESNILENNQLFTLAPVFAFENVITSRRSFNGFGISYTRKYENFLGKSLFDVPDVGFNYSNELNFYLIFGNVNLGLNLHMIQGIFVGYGMRLGLSLF